MQLFQRRPILARRRRVAISEIMGSLLMIGITLIAGAAVFGYVNGQANTSANQVGASQGVNINYLREKESITFVNFDSDTGLSNSLSIYTYNNGAVTLTLNGLSIRGPTCPILTPNCGNANKTIVIFYSSQPTPTWTCSGTYCTSANLPCPTQSASGLSSIPMQHLGRVVASFSLCSLVFASSSSPPLKYSFTIGLQGQYGSTASTIANG